ncbi:UDP-N-acetylmuramoyl-tripeptide--D-alanyl-D-alanine ligase [Primorskyibacter sp. S87]|uniref:UDP-N-acetylmuramoyl-tripeptide--D-alanyl-D- alanine ligase n=1 Tax=Primorskyibacter sp. S87 TaxID=3415126 RepID=UPI003C7AE06E
MTLWISQDAETATHGRATCTWEATGVSIDTRTLQPGDLFVALTAARDGHEFVAQALGKGAAAAMVSRVPDGVSEDAPLLIVEDVQAGLEALGAAARAHTAAKVVAVTGSAGKTSTKEMLSVMLSDQGRTHASVASYNNHWGVPLTLARMPRDTEFAIIEIGMNHPGEIEPLARQARPHVALVTTVAAAHLEAFDSVDDIAREKGAIFQGLLPQSVAVYNAGLPQSTILKDLAEKSGARLSPFGPKDAPNHLETLTRKGDRLSGTARIDGFPLFIELNAAGAHFASNALGALAACVALGADLQRAAESLSKWTPFQGRGARETITRQTGSLDLIDDSYNANPASMAAALDVLAGASGKRHIAIVGDMKELGPQAEALHAGLASLPAMKSIDTVHCVGPLMQSLHAALPEGRRGLWSETCEDLAARLPDMLRDGDIVLVKGSLSMGLARIVDAIRKMGHGERA